ncbi:hypothetical protein RSOLAG1IB_12253 [Rhizoctonia solani AG-1 IB]|uniref:Uncharacterized protein n=1 Tax=Thanatephorus cucumeris (strain AG1-IB / isolate 7/3/14) TaxID=1108050 RepID=A0A0B7FN80_THACB|nr:hypothetical protein RSOLAG1IB_12253 [Rhizoctonia solani AG-1 IB]
MADETMAKSILAIPGMRDLLLAQLGVSPSQPVHSMQTHNTHKERGRSRICTPPPTDSPRGSSSSRVTKSVRSTSPNKVHGATLGKQSDKSKTRHYNPKDSSPPSRSPSRSPSFSRSPSQSCSRSQRKSTRALDTSPAPQRPTSNKTGQEGKRKRSPSPAETQVPDDYDRAYSSYEPGTGKRRGGRVKYTDENGVEKIKLTKLESLRTREAKDTYVRKHGHPYSARVGFKFNPYAKSFAEGELRLIPRPKGDMGRAFKPHEIAGWRTDYDEYLNYRLFDQV